MTTNYIDHRIDNKVSREFRRVVSGKTDITTLANGRERRNAAWKFKKMRFTASYAMLSPEAQEEVVSAFRACNGSLLLFRFRDYGDYSVDQSPINTAGLVDTRTPVQLYKRYYFGTAIADRMIQAVKTCTVSNSIGGTLIDGTFDAALGLFTPTDTWGGGAYVWTGTFDVWVRFASDDLDVTMQTLDIATTDVDLIEQIAYAS